MIVRANSVQEAEPMLRLRHYVYREQRSYLPQRMDRLDLDDHDEGAVHLGVMHHDRMVACCRIVYRPPYPAQEIVPDAVWQMARTITGDAALAELSRLTQDDTGRHEDVEALCEAAIEHMRASGVQWCVALMNTKLTRLLDQHGVHAIRLAPPVELAGRRYLCLIDVSKVPA